MISTPWICLDISTAPLPEAGSFVEPVSAPSNYVDPIKIAEYIERGTADRLERAATDLDLARITAIGVQDETGDSVLMADTDEAARLREVRGFIEGCSIITYGGRTFDLPMLMRRAQYLDVPFPSLNLDRYRSNHVDLMDILSGGDRNRVRSLDFYCRRLAWDDLLPKPLSGADEARVFETGRWDDLRESVKRDVTAIHRLAQWAGIIA